MPVLTGPFSATPLVRIESRVSPGTGLDAPSSSARLPISHRSHRMDTPLALNTSQADAVTEGPIPSPGNSVTRWVVVTVEHLRRSGACGWLRFSDRGLYAVTHARSLRADEEARVPLPPR